MKGVSALINQNIFKKLKTLTDCRLVNTPTLEAGFHTVDYLARYLYIDWLNYTVVTVPSKNNNSNLYNFINFNFSNNIFIS